MTLRRRPVALGLLALMALGCATAREAGRVPSGDSESGVRVAVFADDDARDAGTVLDESISGVLERKERGGWIPVFRTLEPVWTIAGLSPGRYRVRFDLALDPAGQPEALDRPVVETFDVRPGEVVEVEVILDHVSPAAVAAGAVAVVIAAVLLHEWLDDLDLPTPPAPPHWAAEAAFWITLDLATEPAVWVPRDLSPQVTSHFPRDGDLVAAARVRVVFALSEPIDVASLDPGAIRVETEEGELVAGRVDWDPGRWWLTWEPEEDLPRETTFVVTLEAGAAVDPAGSPLGVSEVFEFSTTR
jgi:hypothetical protein